MFLVRLVLHLAFPPLSLFLCSPGRCTPARHALLALARRRRRHHHGGGGACEREESGLRARALAGVRIRARREAPARVLFYM